MPVDPRYHQIIDEGEDSNETVVNADGTTTRNIISHRYVYRGALIEGGGKQSPAEIADDIITSLQEALQQLKNNVSGHSVTDIQRRHILKALAFFASQDFRNQLQKQKLPEDMINTIQEYAIGKGIDLLRAKIKEQAREYKNLSDEDIENILNRNFGTALETQLTGIGVSQEVSNRIKDIYKKYQAQSGVAPGESADRQPDSNRNMQDAGEPPGMADRTYRDAVKEKAARTLIPAGAGR